MINISNQKRVTLLEIVRENINHTKFLNPAFVGNTVKITFNQELSIKTSGFKSWSNSFKIGGIAFHNIMGVKKRIIRDPAQWARLEKIGNIYLYSKGF